MSCQLQQQKKNAYEVLQQTNKNNKVKKPVKRRGAGIHQPQPAAAKTAKQTLVYEAVGQNKVVKTAQKKKDDEQRSVFTSEISF